MGCRLINQKRNQAAFMMRKSSFCRFEGRAIKHQAGTHWI
jgi:hypothetical protein